MGPSWATRQALPAGLDGEEAGGDGARVHRLGEAASPPCRRPRRPPSRRRPWRRPPRLAFIAARPVAVGRTRVALAHGVAAEGAGLVHAEGREDVEDRGVDPGLEVLQRLAVGQRRAVRVLRERGRERRVGLELLPGTALVVAQGDLAQAWVEDDLRRIGRTPAALPRRRRCARRSPAPAAGRWSTQAWGRRARAALRPLAPGPRRAASAGGRSAPSACRRRCRWTGRDGRDTASCGFPGR